MAANRKYLRRVDCYITACPQSVFVMMEFIIYLILLIPIFAVVVGAVRRVPKAPQRRKPGNPGTQRHSDNNSNIGITRPTKLAPALSKGN